LNKVELDGRRIGGLENADATGFILEVGVDGWCF
jgi:hypothetical protein